MRLLLIGLGICALAVVGWIFERATRDRREWTELISWDGKDLGKVEQETWNRLNAIYRGRIDGGADPRDGLRWVSILQNPAGARRVLLFHSTPKIEESGYENADVDVCDGEGSLLHRNTAWRNWALSDPAFEFHADAAIPWCFAQKIGPMARSDADARDFYALAQGRPVLIRVVDYQGKLCRTWYYEEGQTTGPGVPDRTPQQWEDSLKSPHLAEVLETLVWLSGQHTEKDPFKKCWSDTLARPGVRRRLSELASHPHPWVSEAARMVK